MVSLSQRKSFLMIIATLAVAFLGLASVAQTQESSHEMVESDLHLAKRLTDEAVEIMQENPDISADELKSRFSELLSKNPVPYLSDREASELAEYMRMRRSSVQETLNRVNENLAEQDSFPSFPRPELPGPSELPETTAPMQPLSGDACPATYCLFLFELTCPDSNFVRFCFGVWECRRRAVIQCAPRGKECNDDSDCPTIGFGNQRPVEFKCATWVFKSNECVQACNSDDDCVGDEKCKRPFGTSFDRCK